jgi:hypothetical protein
MQGDLSICTTAVLHSQGNGPGHVRKVRGKYRRQDKIRVQHSLGDSLSVGSLENAKGLHRAFITQTVQAMDHDLISTGLLESLDQSLVDIHKGNLVPRLRKQQSNKAFSRGPGAEYNDLPVYYLVTHDTVAQDESGPYHT